MLTFDVLGREIICEEVARGYELWRNLNIGQIGPVGSVSITTGLPMHVGMISYCCLRYVVLTYSM